MALCHVLLKTYGPNDVLLLASLFAKDDKGIEAYYGSEMMREFTCAPTTKGDIFDHAIYQSNTFDSEVEEKDQS